MARKAISILRLPQGYLNSPIIAHSTLMVSLKTFEVKDVEILTYVDDILIMGKEENQVKDALEKLIVHLQTWGWTINRDKKNGPSKQVKFLGIHWTTEGPQIPEQIIDKLKSLKVPENKQEVQHIIGLFGYWRMHIPYLQLLLQPLYKIVRKAQDFIWTLE